MTVLDWSNGMELMELTNRMRECGVVGAGGAGFPSYAKLNTKADTIILNVAECEPLLKLHRQVLENHAFEILSMLDLISTVLDVQKVIIAIKPHYKKAVDAVKASMGSFPRVEIGYLPEVYPAGDEVVTIYETTGRVVPPGKIPIEVGVIVYNVETIYNVYQAVNLDEPVIYKYITVAGEVKKPITLKVPIGMTIEEVVQLAGGATVKEPVFINGGPMTGMLGNGYDVITKTSNAILVMPKDHYLVKKRQSKASIDMKRAMAACCQCQMCTDLCPRNLLGHPIKPHAFMRAATSGAVKEVNTFMDTFFCSQCGLCELYACPQDLSPRTLIGICRSGLRNNGVTPPVDPIVKSVDTKRQHRKIPMERLTSHLNLSKYDVEAPLEEDIIKAKLVKIKLSQHIGAPATAVVQKGDKVTLGQVIGTAQEGKLGVNIHASISGEVIDSNSQFITIKAE